MTSKCLHEIRLELRSENLSVFSYGRLLMRRGQYTAAKSYLKKSYEIFTEVNNENDPEAIDLLNNLAVVHTHVS